MREHKYRAWNKDSKKWECFTLSKISILGSSYIYDYENWCECTGLKDKNGVEIYESDIIKRNGLIYEVRWVQDRWYLISRMKDHSYANQYFFRGSINQEVIGNVYKNPELLEDD